MEKHPYSIGRREEMVLCVRLCRSPLSASFQERGLCALLSPPTANKKKADVILGFLKAWSEWVRISRTRRKKYTPLIISVTMALCRISRGCFHCVFPQPALFLTRGMRKENPVHSPVSYWNFTGNSTSFVFLAEGLYSTLSAQFTAIRTGTMKGHQRLIWKKRSLFSQFYLGLKSRLMTS